MKHRSKLYDIPADELQQLCDTSQSRAELLEKLNMSPHGGNHNTLRKVFKEKNINTEILDKNTKNKQRILHQYINTPTPLENIIFADNDYIYQSSKLKYRLIKEGHKEYRCEKCLNTEWMGQPIPLQLHHKDGNHNNNRLENLQILCPNCHALTDTYAGKNNKRQEKESKLIIYNKDNPRGGRSAGLSDDGMLLYDGYGNYKIKCPKCNSNFMNKEAQMCRDCYNSEKSKPKISKQELHELIENGLNYQQISEKCKIDRDTVRMYLKYYAINEPELLIPDRDILKNKIRNTSIDDICKEYDINKDECKKWFRKQGVPFIRSSIKQISDEKWKDI